MKLHFNKEPKIDNKMTFANNKYELTLEEVKSNFGITYTDDGTLSQRIKKNSRAVYSYIYAIGNPANKRIVDWLLHYTDEGREYIYDALMSQIEADLMTGFNSLVDQPRIDLKTGRRIEESDFISSLVSTPTKVILENSESYVSLNLLYMAKFDWAVWSYYKRWKNG